MEKNKQGLWSFTSDKGDFFVADAAATTGLYFPLANEAGLLSSITPQLSGDAKIGQHSFLLSPVSREDLHASRMGRNFWVCIEGKGLWPLGSFPSSSQREDTSAVSAGLLWHTVIRENKKLGIRAEITNFIPPANHTVELMRVRIINSSRTPITLSATAAIPLFCRSADNLRDHRHVTSLLNRIALSSYGVIVIPTMSFDERGHTVNTLCYGALGSSGKGQRPAGFFPTVESFIGEAGSLDAPKALLKKTKPFTHNSSQWQGKEALGGIAFGAQRLLAGESCEYIVMIGIAPFRLGNSLETWFSAYNSSQKIERALNKTKQFWQENTSRVQIKTADPVFDQWLRWVSVQPTLRKLFGCSFLPDFDYGRGGRGWRDLWQDCLSLLFIDPERTRQLLLNNCAGIRLDGSNATIIGKGKGEFIADRNHIPRVWMDHGFWPLRTLKLYIDQTGDLDILKEKAPYFCDMHTARGAKKISFWNESYGVALKTAQGKIYQGSLMEHLLVQNLVPFFNVGSHNTIRLEAADWNDGLDMAREKGESVAFTHAYAANLEELAGLLADLAAKGMKQIGLLKELAMLLDSLGKSKISYESTSSKNNHLQKYFASIEKPIHGRQVSLDTCAVSADLRRKAQWIRGHLQQNEWLTPKKGCGWFNGYYDNFSRRVEGIKKNKVYMTLTGQVFAIMSGTASDEQIRRIIRSVNTYLQDPVSGNVRLNTDFGGDRLDLGRAFSFSYGEKENGAFFNHMAVMYAYALYLRGFVQEGNRVLTGIYQMAKARAARIYPCLPEYFDSQHRGKYCYLTGSASWYLLTLITQAFGVRGEKGDLCIAPALVRTQFDAQGIAQIHTFFAQKRIIVKYCNSKRLEYGHYAISRILINGKSIAYTQIVKGKVRIARDVLCRHLNKKENVIEVELR